METKTYTLSEFLGSVSEVIEESFDGSYWVTAEVAAAHAKGKGYWVLELQESDDTGNKLAQTQVMVWANAVPRVVYKFEKATGQKLQAGLRIRLLVQAGFHAQWGFRLTGHDIDTSWSLGEAEANNKRIRETLEREGLWDKNKKLPSPNDFFKVGVLAPDRSAGLEDFLKEAEKMQSFGLTTFVTAFAPFEGQNAAKDFPEALRQLVAMHPDLDAICVVRGGGGASGIAWLNHLDIVRSICLCPIPILSGIGHERDNTLVDDCAHIKCGTPSKTIALIVQTVTQNALRAQQNWDHIRHLVNRNIDNIRQRLHQEYRQVFLLAENRIDRARTLCQGFIREALALGPLSVLQRGYAVLRNERTDRVVRTIHSIENKDVLHIRVADGTLRAEVISLHPSSEVLKAVMGGSAQDRERDDDYDDYDDYDDWSDYEEDEE